MNGMNTHIQSSIFQSRVKGLTAIMPLAAMAQHEEDTENGVVSLAGREGFTIETKKGDFVFKPYLLVQTSANLNWYDDTILQVWPLVLPITVYI